MPSERRSSPADSTLGALLGAQAERNPDGDALLGVDGSRLRHAALRDAAFGIRDALADHGWAGARVAIALPPGPDLALAFLGVACGATAAPLDPALRRPELEQALAGLRVDALITGADAVPEAAGAARRLDLPLLDLDGLRRERTSRGAPAVAPDDIALVLRTSGTTAQPKTVPITQAGLVGSARRIAVSLALGPDDRCLNVLPLFHVHGLVGGLLASLAAGGSVVCTDGFRAAAFFDVLERFVPTWYTAVPAIHRTLVLGAARHADTIESCPLRFIRSSSAPLPAALLEELENVFGAPVIEAYGMTEAAHQVAANPIDGVRKPGSVGLPTGAEIAVLDRHGAFLRRGQRGEIAVRGGSVLSGYEGDPASNGQFFSDGWFRTGDEGYLDEDGYLFLTGRIKEIINRGGENVSPREIDEALLAHPDVAEAVAFAIPDRRLGEEVGAAVVLREGTTATPMQLREAVADRLADFKVPRLVTIVERIPTGPTGKPRRAQLALELGIDVDAGRPPRGERVAPRNAEERAVAELFRDALGHDEFGVEDDFFDLGGDSVAAAELLDAIALARGRWVPLLRFLDRPTVAAVTALVAAPPDTDVYPVDDGVRLVPIREEGDGSPLFVMGGHDNVLWGLSAMVRYLPGDRPVFGLETPPLTRRSSYRLEELAAWVVDVLDEARPAGPLYLAGHCFGGWVMFEVARRLSARGTPPALLIMMECFEERQPEALSFRRAIGFRLGLWGRRHDHMRRLREAGDGRFSYLRGRGNHFVTSLAHDLGQAAYDLIGRRGWRHPSWLRTPMYANRSAEAHYVPQPYDGPTLLVSIGSGAPAPGIESPEPSWGELLTGDVEQVRIEGDRQRMWLYPCVRRLGEGLAQRLATRARPT